MAHRRRLALLLVAEEEGAPGVVLGDGFVGAGDDEVAGEAVEGSFLALVLAAAGTGLALSGDLFNIYVFYELTAVASYGLAAARGTGAAMAATMAGRGKWRLPIS